MTTAPSRRRWATRAALFALVLAVVLVGLLFTPVLDATIGVKRDPADSYEQAMEQAQALLAADGPEIDERCRSQVFDSGRRTDRAVVLLHGYTNCPAQFDVIARAYAEAGYSVVVPRLPGHGESDRLTGTLSAITPAAIVDTGDAAVDIATGLGESVTVVGLSGGGTLAGWLAIERDEVDEAILLAPLVVPKVLPEFAVGPVARAFRFAPDVYLWWDGALKDQLASPPYAYPRYSLRSLGAFLAVGRSVQADRGRSSDLQSLVVVSNENDLAVSNAGVDRLADAVQGETTDRVDHVFAEDLGYRHDLVDPEGENATDLAEIYAVLGPLLGLADLDRMAP